MLPAMMTTTTTTTTTTTRCCPSMGRCALRTSAIGVAKAKVPPMKRVVSSCSRSCDASELAAREQGD